MITAEIVDIIEAMVTLLITVSLEHDTEPALRLALMLILFSRFYLWGKRHHEPKTTSIPKPSRIRKGRLVKIKVLSAK